MTPPAKIDVFVIQAGYDAAGPKTATVRVEGIGAAPQSIAMVPAAGGKPVLQGNLTGPIPEPEAGGSNSNFVADFSSGQKLSDPVSVGEGLGVAGGAPRHDQPAGGQHGALPLQVGPGRPGGLQRQ